MTIIGKSAVAICILYAVSTLMSVRIVSPTDTAPVPTAPVPTASLFDPCTLMDVSCATTPTIAVLKEVCDAKGMPARCYATLYGMMMTESRGDCTTQGDYLAGVGFRSRGCFQIQTKLHKITVAQAEDLRFAATWTLDHLLAHNYPTMRSYAIRRHNGWGKSTLAYLATVNSFADSIK